MNIRFIFLFLGVCCSMFFPNENALASDYPWGDYLDSGRSWGSYNYEPTYERGLFSSNPWASQLSYKPGTFETKKPRSAAPVITQADITVASQAVSLACTNAKQDFFGFNPHDSGAMKRFSTAMESLKKAGCESKLLNGWLDRSNTAVKLVGFLNSFGNTLGIANQQLVEDQMVAGLVVKRHSLLENAYKDMMRLISGQVVELDKKRKATKEEALVLLQAAASLGQQYAVQFSPLFHDPSSATSHMVDWFYGHYNLSSTKNRTALLHNTILLKHSVAAALAQRKNPSASIDSLLQRKGLDRGILENASNYLSRMNLYPSPHSYLESVITDTQTTYDSRESNRSLRGIEILSLDPGMVYEKFKPYGKRAFDVLRSPESFIDKLKREFKAKSSLDDRRDWVDETMNSIGLALIDPSNINNIPGFRNGSIERLTGVSQQQQENETKLTWLDAAHDFVKIYFYAETNGLSDKFYNDPTPGDNGPCLPGKIRCFQEWFDVTSGLTSGADTILERIFADAGGIEIPNAINMLYSQYIEGAAILYCMEEKISLEHVPIKKQSQEAVKLALNQEKFHKLYFNKSNLEAGIMDMVKQQLPQVIAKFRKIRKPFPIRAFHYHKFGDAQLENDTRGNAVLLEQIRFQVGSQMERMMKRTLLSIRSFV